MARVGDPCLGQQAGPATPAPRAGSGLHGSSLAELTVALALGGLLVQGVAPAWVEWRQRQRLRGAAAVLAAHVTALQARASAHGRYTGLVFLTREGLAWQQVEDGDGDGLHAEDLRGGVDFSVGEPVELAERFPGIAAGLPHGVAPISGRAPADGVGFGAADRLSLAPDGSATSGTVYLRNGAGQAAALRIYGATGRVSVWEFDIPRRRWTRRR